MHDLDFVHVHVDPEERAQLSDAIWTADNVELTTVGIDIGSSTSHLMFARVHMQRLATALSSRFVVAERKILWESPILLTPYLPDYTIDTGKLAEFVESCYSGAGLERSAIDSGAVILTGEALKRKNARAIADLFSADSGKFVCASAGHHMEAALAAQGSGTMKLSAERKKTLLNVDIGGGTTKFALVRNGEPLATVALAVGGRLLVEDPGQGLVRIEPPIVEVARALGIELAPGKKLVARDRRRLIERMAAILVAMISREAPDDLASRLLVTGGWPRRLLDAKIDAITFSGGVAEYVYGRETRRFGDLGPDLAHALAHAIEDGDIAAPVWDPGHGIRATVTGASQFTVQVSGNTLYISAPDILPLRNLPVLACGIDLSARLSAAAVERAVRTALALSDFEDGSGPVALAFPWSGDPDHARLHAVASGIAAAVPQTVAAALPVILLIEGDVGMTLGRVMHREVAPGGRIVAIDNVKLNAFEYVDIGTPVEKTHVVPVIIKSLVF
jgi:ethanolamine utilization protein EutA (predicted chaperonin)